MRAHLTPQRIGAIRRRLLRWYDVHQQPFPWRSTHDPWAALVAAVCTQQTQMPRVLPLWERWMASFPELADAARASEAEVLRVWGRGGYPKRALYLREAARRCAAHHNGQLPSDEARLLALPGVGPFSAAIVRSFGFGIDAAAVDTNVIRLLGRLVLGDLQPARESNPSELRRIAERLTPRGEAQRWNPAVMDFGGSVCRPRPRCGDCTLAQFCSAYPRFAAGERAEPLRRQARFSGSERQLRGILMQILREQEHPIARNDLLRRVSSESERTSTDVETALNALIRDGLAHIGDNDVSLGANTASGYATLREEQ